MIRLLTYKVISESVRLIGGLIDHADKDNLDGMLFAADVEKAFNLLEHDSLFATSAKLASALIS